MRAPQARRSACWLAKGAARRFSQARSSRACPRCTARRRSSIRQGIGGGCRWQPTARTRDFRSWCSGGQHGDLELTRDLNVVLDVSGFDDKSMSPVRRGLLGELSNYQSAGAPRVHGGLRKRAASRSTTDERFDAAHAPSRRADDRATRTLGRNFGIGSLLISPRPQSAA